MSGLRGRYWFLLFWVGWVAGCGGNATGGAAPTAVAPQLAVQDLDIVSGQTIYVPAYSEVPITGAGRLLELTVTLAIHNTDLTRPIVLTAVRYYGVDGQLVHDYLAQPQRLEPLASTAFIVEPERGSGIGTNFIVEWVAEEPVYEPVVEALMVNASGNQGITFLSPGRVVSQIE